MFFDDFAIPADASHVKNAHLFIDYMLRADVAAKNSNFLSYANSNAASLAICYGRSEEQPERLSRRPRCWPRSCPTCRKVRTSRVS